MNSRASSIVHRLDAILTRERLRVYPSVIVGMYVLFWVLQLAGAPRRFLPDFLARWTAGATVADGHAAALYSPGVQSVLQRSEGAHSLSWFVSPPPAALFFVPFGVLPYAAAAVLWLIISVGGLVIVTYLLRRSWPADRWPYWTAVLMAVASQPVLELIGGGQDSWLVLLSFVVAWRLWRAGRGLGAGIALTPATLVKPQLVLPIIVLLVLCVGIRTLCGLILASAGSAVASAALLGPHVWWDWMRAITSPLFTEQVSLGQAYKAASLPGFLTAISPAGARGVVAQVGLAAGLALLVGWTVWLVRYRPSQSMACSTATFVAVLVAPHAMIYDLVIALPGVGAVLACDRRPVIRVAVACGFVVAWLGPPLSFLRSNPWPISALSAQWVVPVLLGVTLRQMLRCRSTHSGQPGAGTARNFSRTGVDELSSPREPATSAARTEISARPFRETRRWQRIVNRDRMSTFGGSKAPSYSREESHYE